MSALEHAVPERFFSDRANKCNLVGEPDPKPGLPACPQGISAVKALALAAAQGQRIYTITQKVFQDNPGLVASQLSAHSWDTQQRVQQALEAGQEVTIHQRPVLQDGWAGAGFVLLDPETGAGRYLIEGGGNGGQFALGVGLGSLSTTPSAQGLLRELLPAQRPPDMPLTLLYAHRRQLPALVRFVMDWLASVVADHLQADARPGEEALTAQPQSGHEFHAP